MNVTCLLKINTARYISHNFAFVPLLLAVLSQQVLPFPILHRRRPLSPLFILSCAKLKCLCETNETQLISALT